MTERSSIFSLPNFLSFLRFPLALLFLQENPFIRILAIILALITDGLDGFLARRNGSTTTFGTLLDPLADKFFVLFTLGILLTEQSLELWQILAIFSRDFAIVLFGFYLAFKGKLKGYSFKAFWCGKITTVLQLLVLAALVWHISVPSPIFVAFILLGLLTLLELGLRKEGKGSQEPGVRSQKN